MKPLIIWLKQESHDFLESSETIMSIQNPKKTMSDEIKNNQIRKKEEERRLGLEIIKCCFVYSTKAAVRRET